MIDKDADIPCNLMNEDSIRLFVSFLNYRESYSNNKPLKGFEVVRALYEKEKISSYYDFNDHRFKIEIVEVDSISGYMIYKSYDSFNNIDDQFNLFGYKNGYTSNFRLTVKFEWTENEKIVFLKSLYNSRRGD